MYITNLLLLFLVTSVVDAFSLNSCTRCPKLNATIKDIGDRCSLIEIDLKNIYKVDCKYWWSKVCDSSSVMQGHQYKSVFKIELSKPLPDNLQIFVWCQNDRNLKFVGMWNRKSEDAGAARNLIGVLVPALACSVIGILLISYLIKKLIRRLKGTEDCMNDNSDVIVTATAPPPEETNNYMNESSDAIVTAPTSTPCMHLNNFIQPSSSVESCSSPGDSRNVCSPIIQTKKGISRQNTENWSIECKRTKRNTKISIIFSEDN